MTDVQVQGFLLAKRAPVVGDVEFFTADEETSRAGKPYIRVRRNSAEYNGKPYKVLDVSPTGGDPDKHGNQGYGITLAATTEEPTPYEPQAAPPSKADLREEHIAQAGAYNAAVELVASGRVPIDDTVEAAIEYWHGALLPFRQSIVGIEPAPPTEPVAAADENGQPPEVDTVAPPPADDDIPF